MTDLIRVQIDVPPIEEVIQEGCPVGLAGKGATWIQSCLGQKGKETGVYVIHHGRDVKYVGKTNGPTMSFGVRLRREFQESASGGKHLYPQLAALATPPPIMVYLFSAADIRKRIESIGVAFEEYQVIEIFETVLIHVYQPQFQRHHEKRNVALLTKLNITSDPAALLALLKKSSQKPAGSSPEKPEE